MNEINDSLWSKMWFLIAVGLITACLTLLSQLPFGWDSPAVEAREVRVVSASDGADDSSGHNPNVVANAMSEAINGVGRIADTTEQVVSDKLGSFAKSATKVSAQGGKFAIQGVGNGASLAADGLGGGIRFMVHGTTSTFSLIANTPPVSALIRPANDVAVPVINLDEPALASTQSNLSAVTMELQPQVDSAISWPMEGNITTRFGVPHWPYQPTHTGIDISDGQRSGVTPITPFKSGQVIETVLSTIGLGNHVVVNHGGGMTSVYAHLSTISVNVGQEVNTKTVLGYVGSTGASTGPHLHFEIRIDGQSVNPMLYINGQP